MGEGSAAAGDLIIGHVVAVKGATLTASLIPSTRGRDAAIGDLIAIPTQRGRAYGVVNGLRKGRRDEDRSAVDLQLLGEAVPTAQGASASSAASPPIPGSMRRSWR